MPNIIGTIYSKGVYRPLGKVNLPENTKVEIATLIDYSVDTNPKQLLKCLKYAQELFQKSGQKIPPGVEFQRKIRNKSQAKINARLKKLDV